MSTSDQQGNQPLTRKQLREIRLTGATPVISEDQAASAAATPPRPAASSPSSTEPAEAAEAAPAPRSDADVDLGETRLTRRQVREQERVRTSSVPVVDFDEESADDASAQEEGEAPQEALSKDEIVSGVPYFTPATAADEAADAVDDDLDEIVVDVEPVSAAAADSDEVSALGITDESDHDAGDDDDLSEDDDPIETGERPIVNSMFGKELLDEQADVPAFTPSFDELITSDSGGSQHLAPNTLIFNPSPGGGSLSGPVASTGELLITGSYDLPRGIGSQGHAHGTADGKESDAVLIDGELPPSSSPTPIAASSAISTTKPAGEVIRPPAPEKGNKLMLTLAIMAGGLALALAVVLIVGFTMNVF